MVLERMHTSLRELLKVSKKPDQHNMIFVPGGGIRPAVVLTFARQMLEALSHIHGLAFAHLDIKVGRIRSR